MADKVDPNTYALSVFLDLDTTEAFSSLDAFEDNVLKIEEKVSEAAQKSMGSLDGSANQAAKAIDEMQTAVEGITATGSALTTSMDASNFSGAEQSLSRMADIGDRISSAFSDAKDSIDMSGAMKDQLDASEKMRDAREEYRETAEQLKDILENENSLVDELLKLWKILPKVLAEKNQLHKEEAKMVKEEGDLASILGENFAEVLETTNNILRLYKRGSQLLSKWAGWFAKLDEHSENFYTTNYRLYGTQQAMVQQARLMSTESGVFMDRMLATMKVLGDLRIPREEMEKYAKAIGQAERVTGVAAETLATYSWSLRSVGIEGDRVTEHLRVLQEEQRKLGISSSDMSKMLDQSAMSALELSHILGDFGDGKEVENFRRLQMQLTHLGKEMGLSAEMGLELQKMMSDTKGMALLTSQIRHGEKGTEAFRLALLRLGNVHSQSMDSIIALQQQGAQGSAAYRVQLDSLASALGMSKEMVLFQVGLRKIAKEQGLNLQNTEDWTKALKILKKGSMDPFDEATQGLYRSLGELYNSISNLVGYALQPLANALGKVVGYLTWFIQKVTIAVKWLNQMFTWLSANIPGFEILIGLISMGVVVIGGFVVVLAALAVALGVIPGLVGIVSTAIKGFFLGLGQGIAAFSSVVAVHTTTLLKLGLAFALVGAGVYLLALGFQMVAQEGWNGIGMFAAFLGISALFILALVGIAFAAQYVIVPLVVLGAVVALIGLGFMMAGVGMYMMAASLQMIAAYGHEASAAMWSMSGSILALGGAGILAFAGLMLLGVALWFIAIPIFLLAVGFQMLAGAIELLTFDAVMAAANALWESSTTFLAAAAILLPAGILLAVGGALMLVGAALLLVASVAVIIAGAAFAVGAGILLAGGIMFAMAGASILAGALMIFLSGAMIVIGAGAMIAGLALMYVATTMMYGASAAMFAASWALSGGAAALLPGAAMLLAAGVAIFIGAGGFYLGALMLQAGGAILSTIGDVLQAAAGEIIEASGIMLVAAGHLLLFGSVILLASGLVALGAVALVVGVTALLGASLYMLGVAAVLTAASLGLVIAGTFLWLGAYWIGAAVKTVAEQSGDFYKFADAMANIAAGLGALSNTRSGAIKKLASEIKSAAPELRESTEIIAGISDQFKDAIDTLTLKDANLGNFDSVMNQISQGVNQLVGTIEPMDRLAQSLDLINQTLIDMDENAANLVDNLSNFGPMLEQQAEQIGIAAQRIQEAVENRGVPAMRAAQDAGLAQVQQGDTIATVQVMTNQEGGVVNRSDELAETTNAHLSAIKELLAGIVDGEDTKGIKDLLAAALPGLGRQNDSNLHNSMGGWG